MVTGDGDLLAVDAKINLDDNGLFRHADLAEMFDPTQEDDAEVIAGEYGLNYISLDGNVACMVNGAGLAMATMDLIQKEGGEPANFLGCGWRNYRRPGSGSIQADPVGQQGQINSGQYLRGHCSL